MFIVIAYDTMRYYAKPISLLIELFITVDTMTEPNSPSTSTLGISEVDSRQMHYLSPFSVEILQKITAKTKDGREYKRDSLIFTTKTAKCIQKFRWIPAFHSEDRELWAQITTYLLINPDVHTFTFTRNENGGYILNAII